VHCWKTSSFLLLRVSGDLREGGPLAVLLHAAAQALVLQDVDRREGRLQLVEDLRAQPVTRAVSVWRPSPLGAWKCVGAA